jgi:hypothetical protein
VRLKAAKGTWVSCCDGKGNKAGRQEPLTEDDGVGGEDGELGMQLVEEVKLVCRAADGSGEEEGIALQPRHLGRRVLETDTWAWLRHVVFVQLA